MIITAQDKIEEMMFGGKSLVMYPDKKTNSTKIKGFNNKKKAEEFLKKKEKHLLIRVKNGF